MHFSPPEIKTSNKFPTFPTKEKAIWPFLICLANLWPTSDHPWALGILDNHAEILSPEVLFDVEGETIRSNRGDERQRGTYVL